MKYYCLTLFPEMIEQTMHTSITGRALENGIISLETIDIRKFTDDKHGRIDDYPYGGGAGMLMQAEPVTLACEYAKKKSDNNARVIYVTPKGKTLNQNMVKEFASEKELIILCGHYEGIDERALELNVTDYVSVGDYVLTGGELPALIIMDAVSRLVPGVLHNEESPETESFEGDTLENPQYTRPEIFRGLPVPEVLLSGHHENIRKWRRKEALLATKKFRPDMFEKINLSEEDKLLLGLIKPEKKRRRKKKMITEKQKVQTKFAELFGESNANSSTAFFAPGRINLIGEHTDYNGGHVFPCALTIGTYAAAAKNDLGLFRLFSLNMEEETIECRLESIENRPEQKWANYPLGVIKTFINEGYNVNSGIDFVFCGNIPNSSGLSSSASIEVLTAYILKTLFSFDIDLLNISLLCQKAENEFVGVKCGILDQFAIAMGQKDHAIMLNTGTMKYTYAPLNLEGLKIVIMNTRKKRGLADSKYNERRSECEDALAELKTVLNIGSLGDLSDEEFDKNCNVITDPVKRKRARHAVYENNRTKLAIEALNAGDIEELGRLMVGSHRSLQYDYEVTGNELDAIVDAALLQKGVLGARMTGAGFGGCAISIVKQEYVDEMIKNVSKLYEERTGLKAEFYVVETGMGPSEV